MQARLDRVWRDMQDLKARIAAARARLRTGGMADLGSSPPRVTPGARPSPPPPPPPPTALRKGMKQVRCLGRHSDKVTALWWATSGRQVMVATQDGRLSLWDAGPSGDAPVRASCIHLRSAWVMTVCLDNRWGIADLTPLPSPPLWAAFPVCFQRNPPPCFAPPPPPHTHTVFSRVGYATGFPSPQRARYLSCCDRFPPFPHGSEKPMFAASGGVDNLCSIHGLSDGASTRVTLRELSAHDGCAARASPTQTPVAWQQGRVCTHAARGMPP
jgi:hypothetical protein